MNASRCSTRLVGPSIL